MDVTTWTSNVLSSAKQGRIDISLISCLTRMGVCELIGSKRWASVRHPLTVCNTEAELILDKFFTCFGLRLTEALDLRWAVLVWLWPAFALTSCWMSCHDAESCCDCVTLTLYPAVRQCCARMQRTMIALNMRKRNAGISNLALCTMHFTAN